jgi:hypothetical protein
MSTSARYGETSPELVVGIIDDQRRRAPPLAQPQALPIPRQPEISGISARPVVHVSSVSCILFL